MFTEEELLRKFKGNRKKAEIFMEVFLKSELAKLEKSKQLSDPAFIDSLINDPKMKWNYPRWKKVLVNLRLAK